MRETKVDEAREVVSFSRIWERGEAGPDKERGIAKGRTKERRIKLSATRPGPMGQGIAGAPNTEHRRAGEVWNPVRFFFRSGQCETVDNWRWESVQSPCVCSIERANPDPDHG